jgi:hypothetical protein
MTGIRAAIAGLVYLCIISSAEAFTFSTDALHALAPSELPQLASSDAPVLLWMEPGSAANPRENLFQVCALANGEVYASGAEVASVVEECVIRQSSLLGNAWMKENRQFPPYTWYRLSLTKGELSALAAALTPSAALPEPIRSELAQMGERITDVSSRIAALEASLQSNADGDGAIAKDFEDLSSRVTSLSSTQEALRGELEALKERPPDEVAPLPPPDPVIDFFARYWRIILVAVIILIAAAILLRAMRQRKESSPLPPESIKKTDTKDVEVILVPTAPPYTEAKVSDGILRDTIRVEMVGESEAAGSHERVYKTPYAPRVRESNLREHISTQWQKSHP